MTSVWVTSWSDSEDDDFREAWRSAGIDVEVIRSRPLGPTVGRRSHRVRSWPASLRLAVLAGRRARGRPVVAWQPSAGALASWVPGRRFPLIALNPIVRPRRGFAERLLLSGLRRCETVVFFSRRAVAAAVAAGVDGGRACFVPLGVRARNASPPPARSFLVAAGREDRDWLTLASAARGLDVDVFAVGPRPGAGLDPLRVLPQTDRPRFLELLAGATALVVPLHTEARTAGQLAVLDAMAMGRAVVATRTHGTEDYVSDATGFLVPPGDPAALRAAMVRVLQPGVAELLGQAGLAAARGPFSLERFVSAMDALAMS